MLPTPPTARLLAQLQAAGLLPPAQVAAIAEAERARPFSLHYELRALLYLGSTLLAGGLGVLLYENRDSLGHSVITALMAAAMLACFAYAARHRPAFSWGEAPRTRVAADYLLLLGCLLFLGLEGYVQVQYGMFGQRYGLATLLPALVFFPLAYRYDHRGVLGLGIAAVGTWVGVSTSPLAVLRGELFESALAGPALGLGVVLLAAGLASEYFRRKPHFAFTYLLAGSNLAEVGALGLALTRYDWNRSAWVAAPWLLLALGLALALVWYARRSQSYLFLLLGAAYGYVAFTLLGILLLLSLGDMLWPLAIFYFPSSLAGLILMLVNLKKIVRRV
ncbi:DUF2157 domain-containing protein [Hymenobacter sp. RP-2-7]|uniref:DUF2157 domain-containing protein n=1 Tax=Hymenobacter polaris TaxID=2682546 RepID=A0A7Y0AFI9_9BACT|nr:DUF2157 domain-containing protein [Hymenobacter polaris]NML66416.1 DUF2157 domain-containing protein [Hymenobacter polaris]